MFMIFMGEEGVRGEGLGAIVIYRFLLPFAPMRLGGKDLPRKDAKTQRKTLLDRRTFNFDYLRSFFDCYRFLDNFYQ